MAIQSLILQRIRNIRHSFGAQGDKRDHRLPIWKQTHGVLSVEVNQPNQNCGEVDALYCFSDSLPIAVATADCVPILLAHVEGKGVAAVHAGWRGTRSKILTQLWTQLVKLGHHPRDWVAAIGPAIGPCCYEVSTELALEFKQLYPNIEQTIDRHIDLQSMNAQELKDIGLNDVDVLRYCTFCSQSVGRFNSYRRDAGSLRQWSMIEIIESK